MNPEEEKILTMAVGTRKERQKALDYATFAYYGALCLDYEVNEYGRLNDSLLLLVEVADAQTDYNQNLSVEERELAWVNHARRSIKRVGRQIGNTPVNHYSRLFSPKNTHMQRTIYQEMIARHSNNLQ